MSGTAIIITNGFWYTVPGDACTAILSTETKEVIGLFNEHGDAVVAACAKDMLAALDRIQRICTFLMPDETPTARTTIDPAQVREICDIINAVFEKIENEVTL